MMIGTIIGEISTAMIARRNGISGRERPRAASVPRKVARMRRKKPMITEFFAALIQAALAQASAHHDAVARRFGRVHAEGQQQVVPTGGIARRIEAEHLFGEGEIGLGVEAERNDDEDRRDQEQEDQRRRSPDRCSTRSSPSGEA